MHGAYAVPITQDAFNLAVANSAIFLVAYHLITLAYFLGPGKINPDTIQGSPISGLFARYPRRLREIPELDFSDFDTISSFG